MSYAFKKAKDDKFAVSMQRRPRAVRLDTGSECLTEQAHADTCDINKILARYAQTGHLTHVRQQPMQYLDLTGVEDFQQAMNVVARAQAAFDALPAALREKFNNNPALFVKDYQEFQVRHQEELRQKKKDKDKAPPAPKPE